MQMRSLSFAALALALAMGGVAHAKSGSKPDKNAPPVQLNVEESAAQQMERIERALGTEQYNEIGPDDRLKVQAALNRIRARLAGQETVAQVNPQARTDIYNDQQLINTILTRAHADSRMVCRRERTVGSNMPQQVCMTVAQRREAMEASKEMLRNANRGPGKGTF